MSRGHRPTRSVQTDLWVCCRSGNTSILGSAEKRRHRADAQTTAKNGSVVSQRVFPFVRVGFLSWFWSGFPFLFWTTLFASWGSVSFSSVPCLASTVPFPMTPPYVGGTSSFLSPFLTHVSRYAPGSPKPGVSKPTSPRPPALAHTVRLLAGCELQRPPVK